MGYTFLLGHTSPAGSVTVYERVQEVGDGVLWKCRTLQSKKKKKKKKKRLKTLYNAF